MPAQFGETPADHPLTLAYLVHALHRDGRMSDSEMVRLSKATIRGVHPLVFIADQKIADQTRQGRLLDMDTLLHWLGERSGQDVYRIDPLKINVSAVAEVMSRAFAERHKILAVETRSDEVLIASAEPDVRGWEKKS